MFDEDGLQIFLLITIAAVAIGPARYIYDYIANSPRYHDITAPPADLEWRTQRRLIANGALLAGLMAAAIFMFLPQAEHFAQSPEFLPTILAAMGTAFLLYVCYGLLEGRMQPLVRGFSKSYQRESEPKRFWLSFAWNALVGVVGIGTAFAALGDHDQRGCYNRFDDHTPTEQVEVCTTLLAEGDIPDMERGDILASRGQAHYLLNHYEAALADYDRFLELKPDNFSGYFRRGLLHLESMRLGGAIADFTRAHEIEPDDQWTLANRGIAYAWMNERALAEKDFAAVEKLDADNPVMLHGLALLHMQAEEFQQAVTMLDRALEIDPQDYWSLRVRSDAYWELGEKEKSSADNDLAYELEEQKAINVGQILPSR